MTTPVCVAYDTPERINARK